jgi:hypothetical protein
LGNEQEMSAPPKELALRRIEELGREDVTTVWRLDAKRVLSRLAELVVDPSKVSQSSLNLCGPAAFLMLWLKRDPMAVVEFTKELFSGSAYISSLRIWPHPTLLQRDYEALERKCPPAEWMLLSALRDSTNQWMRYRGTIRDNASAITFPSEIVRWLKATNIYRTIANDTKLLRPASFEEAASLRPNETTDVMLLINKRMFGFRENPIVDRFPNHYVVLDSPITETPDGKIDFTAWSWGGKYPQQPIAKSVFERNCYGAIVATI